MVSTSVMGGIAKKDRSRCVILMKMVVHPIRIGLPPSTVGK